MTDLHCHILPALDDGSPDLDTSVEMAAMAAANNTSIIVATPPSGFLADADSFIRYSDGVLYVIKSDYASKSQIVNNLQALSESGANIMGYIIKA